jgi:dUTP pyrophosphatase
MTNCAEAKEYYARKHFYQFKQGGYAEVINDELPQYGKVGLIVDVEEYYDEDCNIVVLTFDDYAGYIEFAPEYLRPCNKPKLRGFEQISAIKTEIPMPMRKTKASAGYDIGIIHPTVYDYLCKGYTIEEAWDIVPKVNGAAIVTKESEATSIILPTGIKAYMQDNEVLVMAVRSSSGIKKAIRQANPPSWIDADYYNNPDNEGHIKFAISNDSIRFDAPIINIAQGIFMNYLVADTGNSGYERIGGIGSTGQ